MIKSREVLITGGQGALAQAIAGCLSEVGMGVHSPGRDELDVCDEGSVVDYFSGIKSLDLLVCNAGFTDDGVVTKMSEGSWDDVMDANLKGAFLCARAAAKVMMRQKVGHIVFVSSYSAFHPPVGQANYAASKAGLTGLAKSMAQELGGRNIRVNVVIPGFMETKMTEGLPDEVYNAAREKHVLREFNTVEAVGEFLRCLHLEMKQTSGQVFNLDSRII